MKSQAREYQKHHIQQRGTIVDRRPRALINLLAILVAVLLIGVLVGCSSLPQETPQLSGSTPETAIDAATPSASDMATPTLVDAVSAQTRHFIGEPGAPVTIIEFGDFQ